MAGVEIILDRTECLEKMQLEMNMREAQLQSEIEHLRNESNATVQRRSRK